MPANFEIAFSWVFLLIPLPLLVYLLVPALRIRSPFLRFPLYADAQEYTGERPRKSAFVKKRGWFNAIALWLAWLLLLAAMSGPQLVGEPEYEVKTTRNFLIAADISFSMAQKDWETPDGKITRWEGVKGLMQDFISEREGDRMGLILFATNAYIQAPFTKDLETVSLLVDETDVGMAGQMTHIGKAIAKGMEMFDQDTLPSQVMLLLTDGVDSGTEVLPLDAANLAKNDSILIYTVGIGKPGDGGSDLDEQTLMNIAEATGGEYFLAQDQERLAAVYKTIDELEPIEIKEKERKPLTLLYPYPLAAGLAIIMIFSLVQNLFRSAKEIQSRRKEAAHVH